MAKKASDQEVLETIVKAMVDNPDEVKVERNVDEMGVLLTLNVADEDMGSVIGRQGRTAQALRTILRVIGAKNNARVNLKLAEPEGSARRRPGADTAAGGKKQETPEVDDLEL